MIFCTLPPRLLSLHFSLLLAVCTGLPPQVKFENRKFSQNNFTLTSHSFSWSFFQVTFDLFLAFNVACPCGRLRLTPCVEIDFNSLFVFLKCHLSSSNVSDFPQMKITLLSIYQSDYFLSVAIIALLKVPFCDICILLLLQINHFNHNTK